MKIYVDENKGDRNSFYLLAYVYGEDSDISSFQQAASVVKAHHPRLGSSFKGIHANKIDVSKRTVIAYVQDILNLFQQYLSQNKLHYFIFIQSTQKVIKNFGTVKNYLNNIIQGIFQFLMMNYHVNILHKEVAHILFLHQKVPKMNILIYYFFYY